MISILLFLSLGICKFSIVLRNSRVGDFSALNHLRMTRQKKCILSTLYWQVSGRMSSCLSHRYEVTSLNSKSPPRLAASCRLRPGNSHWLGFHTLVSRSIISCIMDIIMFMNGKPSFCLNVIIFNFFHLFFCHFP